MEEKMSVMGVGAKIAVPVLLYTAVTWAVSWFLRPRSRLARDYRSLPVVGSLMAAVGFALNLVAALSMLKANREDHLVTTGLYRVFRDPMYVLQILLTLPGLFLLCNSWLVLTGVLPAYIAYRGFVREEHRYLKAKFGQQYDEYLKTVLLKI